MEFVIDPRMERGDRSRECELIVVWKWGSQPIVVAGPSIPFIEIGSK